jgi:sucrose-6-phosphate hydrolase SacC (GH32 family)
VITHPTGALKNEIYRPQFHFTPARNWMNDPNGLLYYKGEYHLFFQHNPKENIWGNMSWGHAVSSDLQGWEELAVAIPCTDDVGIFSGSAVIDYENTSGFGSKENPAMVAIYTEHKSDKSGQTQCLAFSLDQGRTFTKYAGNPVIDLQMSEFRDPKVQWIDGQWLMTIALPDLHQISFYSSPNLKEWKHLSNFGPAAQIGGCWECPDLFKLGNKWVLIVSLNPGGYQIGSGTQYFIGDWNGKEFIADDLETRWLDYGRDNYAGVTFNDAPEGKRIFIGWMSNWEYAHNVPTNPWRSAMTLPRELSLKGNRLIQKPIADKSMPRISFSTTGGSIRISESADKFVEIGFKDGKIFMDATNTWYQDFAITRQEIACSSTEVDFEIYIDRGSIELFAGGGKVAITNLIFVETALTSLTPSGELRNLTVTNFS